MAISALKTWIAGEVLTATDLNNEFSRIYTGAGSGTQALSWPATSSKNFAGYALVLDADGDTTMTADTDDRIDIALGGVDLFRFNGTVASSINGFDFIAKEAGVMPGITVTSVSDTNVDFNIVPMGTGDITQSGTRVLLLGDEHSERSILASQVFG